jgi:hypothetical protein
MKLLLPFGLLAVFLGPAVAQAQVQLRQSPPQGIATPFPSAAGGAGLGPLAPPPPLKPASPQDATTPPTPPYPSDPFPTKPLNKR